MSLIAWALFAWFALQGGIGIAKMIASPVKGATVTTVTLSVLIMVALYGWLLWAVVRLATT